MGDWVRVIGGGRLGGVRLVSVVSFRFVSVLLFAFFRYCSHGFALLDPPSPPFVSPHITDLTPHADHTSRTGPLDGSYLGRIVKTDEDEDELY